MNVNSEASSAQQPKVASKRLSFGIGNLLLIVLVVAVAVAWWLDRNRVAYGQYDVPGPLTVSYDVRQSSNSRISQTLGDVIGIDLKGDCVVIHTDRGGVVLPQSGLIKLTWSKDWSSDDARGEHALERVFLSSDFIPFDDAKRSARVHEFVSSQFKSIESRTLKAIDIGGDQMTKVDSGIDRG